MTPICVRDVRQASGGLSDDQPITASPDPGEWPRTSKGPADARSQPASGRSHTPTWPRSRGEGQGGRFPCQPSRSGRLVVSGGPIASVTGHVDLWEGVVLQKDDGAHSHAFLVARTSCSRYTVALICSADLSPRRPMTPRLWSSHPRPSAR